VQRYFHATARRRNEEVSREDAKVSQRCKGMFTQRRGGATIRSFAQGSFTQRRGDATKKFHAKTQRFRKGAKRCSRNGAAAQRCKEVYARPGAFCILSPRLCVK